MKFNFDDLYEIESDASNKKIYRFKNHDQGKIIVDFSYNYNDYLSFLEINKLLSNINVSVPKIFDTDDTKGIIMMEDFGNSRYDKLINSIDPKEILTDAVNALIKIQNTQKPTVNNILKQYNFSTFEIEIAEFADYYLPINNTSNDLVKEFFYIWKQEFENLNFNYRPCILLILKFDCFGIQYLLII